VTVYYKQDAQYKVELKAQQNILDILESYVSNNKLVLRFENDKYVKSHDPIVVTIHAPTINSMEVSGSGTVQSTGNVQAATMDLKVSGSGNIIVEQLQTTPLEARISGSGRISVNGGTAMTLDLKISGSGRIDVGDLVAGSATATVSGSGDMWLQVNNSLDANISGSGNIFYRGNPTNISTSISGSGKVKPF
jgi:hypothetical protein